MNSTSLSGSLAARVHETLTGEDDGRICRDIPDSACEEQPRNFLVHVMSLAATKTGDGLADPKLVLAWLLSSLGAPAFLIGLLVPVREAGALLPQLFTAGVIREMQRRKWVWVAGSAVQGLSVAGMGLAALLLDGAAAGWVVVGLLAVFAVARSVCSVSYKDVLGKTVSKATRGTATGTAGTVSAVFVLLFGVALALGLLDRSVTVVAAALFVAAGLWLFAAVLFASLAEAPGATEGGGNPITVVFAQFSLLRDDPQLTRFILVRGLLTATALAPPYLVSLSGGSASQTLGTLGVFVVASGLATIVSNYVWGRLSDRSSRRVLMLSSWIGAVTLASTAGVAVFATDLLANVYIPPLMLFVLMIGYQGVRLGRATHIVDMADADRRASYTALSNTSVGLLLLAGGGFGAVAELFGVAAVLSGFAAMCVCAALAARGLDDVQDDD